MLQDRGGSLPFPVPTMVPQEDLAPEKSDRMGEADGAQIHHPESHLGPPGGKSPGENKEHKLKKMKKIKKADISLPKDFVHVSTVKYRRKVKVDFSDPVVQNFLQRAGVNVNELSNPGILHLVTKFIERVGLEAIRKESESCGPLTVHADTEIQIPSKSLLVVDTDHDSDSSLKSTKSLIFSPEHDIEITREMDDVFTTQLDGRLSVFSSENYEERIESPKTRMSNTSEGEGKVSHATFLNELQAAIRKREIRMKLKRQAEQKYGDEIWSDFKSSAKSKRRVSFFEPERSPSPKQLRIVHTRWDLTDESSETDNSVLKDMDEGDSNDIYRVGQSGVVDDCDENSKMECNVKTSVEPNIPLSVDTKALNKIFLIDKLNESGISDVDNAAVHELLDCDASDSVHQEKHRSICTPLESIGEGTSREFQSLVQEVSPARGEDLSKGTKGIDEVKHENPDKSHSKENKTPGKRRVAQWFSRQKNYKTSKEINNKSATSEEPEANVENQKKENNVIESPRTNKMKKKRREKGNKLKAHTLEEGKVEGEQKELKSISINEITNLETPIKNQRKHNHSVFNSFMGKKKISVDNAAKEELPKSSEKCTDVSDIEKNQDDTIKISKNLHKLIPPSKKQSDEARRRMVVKKKDIQVEKLCSEMPPHKQRRNSYSMALDRTDFDFGKHQIKSNERSFSLSTASRVFSRGEKKRMPIPRPKSDLPKYEHGVYL